MAAPWAGFEYPSQEVAWLKRDVLLFAHSIGCTVDELHFLYVCALLMCHLCFPAVDQPRNCIPISRFSLLIRSSFLCVPLTWLHFPHRLMLRSAFKQTDQEIVDFYARSNAISILGVPKFDNHRVVDGQRLIVFLKPLPFSSEGRKFELRSRVIGVYDKGKAGSVVETETVLSEKGGDDYTRAIGSAFFVGQGNWGGPKGITISAAMWNHLVTVQQVQVHPTSRHQKAKIPMSFMLPRLTGNLPTSTGLPTRCAFTLAC